MDAEMPSLQKQVMHRRRSAEENWRCENSLLELGHYHMSLFTCHLAIEKYLKALVMLKTERMSPRMHNLNRLAELAGLDRASERERILDEITHFNIEGRYEDEKLAFYKRSTKTLAQKYLSAGRDIIIWLKKEFQKEFKKKFTIT